MFYPYAWLSLAISIDVDKLVLSVWIKYPWQRWIGYLSGYHLRRSQPFDASMNSPLTRIPLRSCPGHPLPDFFAGPENRLVAHVCQSLPSLAPFAGPLLLVGDSAVGKSVLADMLFARESTSDDGVSLPAVDFARNLAAAVER